MTTRYYIRDKKGRQVSLDFLILIEAHGWVSERKYVHYSIIELSSDGEKVVFTTIEKSKGKKKNKDEFDNEYADNMIQLFALTDIKFVDIFPGTGKLYYRYIETKEEANKLYSYIKNNEFYGKDFIIKEIFTQTREIWIQVLDIGKYGKHRTS